MSAACADLGLECPSLAALCTPGLRPHVCRGQGCACQMHLPKSYAKVMGADLPALRRRSQHITPYARFSGASLAWLSAVETLYTDGSCAPPERSNAAQGTAVHIVGAGVYCKATGLQLRVNPCGLGPTSTITRAELVAIWCSLQHAPQQACVIATGSKASMHMIQNELAGLGR